MWQVDLVGEQTDIGELRELAPLCGCTIDIGTDGRQCLSGEKFDVLSEPEEMRVGAAKTLILLNGLARLKYDNHRPVQLGTAVSRVGAGGRRDVSVALQGVELRLRCNPVSMTITRADGSIEMMVSGDKDIERLKRIVADPKLIEIVEAFAGDINWQKLRVAFEKINALVGKGDNAFVKHGYATQDELDRFKANVQDPRHSGLDAVHGIPKGQLKGTRMSE
jgi:hypothetical protein